MPAPTVYKSSDTSAPVLTGQVGSLIALLDACLVNGYGSKSAAGWTKPFSGTNTAVYLPSAGHYLDVNDNAAGAGGAQEATVRAYETMTAVATGTNPFPTVAQRAAPGLFVRKSADASSTPRAWVLFADSTTFYLFILSADTANTYHAFGFGRFYSFKTADSYRSFIAGNVATGGGASNGLGLAGLGSTSTSTITGWYVARTHAGTGTSLAVAPFGVGANLHGSAFNGPNAADGLIYLSRIFLSNGSASAGLHGYMRGLYQILTSVGLNDGDTFSGSGDFAGRTFVVVRPTVGNASFAVETSAWDASA